MKYVTYEREGRQSMGVWYEQKIFDIASAARSFGNRHLQTDMIRFLEDFEMNHRLVSDMFSQSEPYNRPELFFPDGQATILSPLPRPRSLRIFSGYEQPYNKLQNYFQITSEFKPYFYFGNHQSIRPPISQIRIPADTSDLDFEVQIATVITKEGRDLSEHMAGEIIGGFMLYTSLIDRTRQKKEIHSGYGLSKSVDFGSIAGPYFVSKNEFENFHRDGTIDTNITILINNNTHTETRTASMTFPFTKLVSVASQNCTLYPGDLICSGSVEKGSIMAADKESWLAAGDTLSVDSNDLGNQKITIQE
jgi:fumarylacetoacetate (FAA) hydrolase